MEASSQSDLSIASLATIEAIDDAIQKDKNRYVRKGYGLIVAIFIALSTYLTVPHIMLFVHSYLEGMEEIKIFLLVQLSTTNLSYVIGNIYMYIIYSLKLPFFERYKVDNNPWPWEKSQESWNQTKKKVLLNWILNSTISSLLTVGSVYGGQKFRHDSSSIPSYFELAWQIAFCMIVEDASFYWLHRTLHSPRFYHIHKKHHEFYNTISLAAEYQHPIEFVLTSTATALGPLLLGSHMHVYTLGFWYIVRVFETIDGHCGYEFSWSPYRLLPFSGSSEYHHYHHSHNIGNFSSFFYYWDTLCGTNKDYFNFRKARNNETKLNLMRKVYHLNQQKTKTS
ncbi:unnamed protein product (macronuclear) [Paramecium tetraurelia]|uniref:Fatty acid hydroxylase domain-containing protein n=1 Tax=Paramecium tetraurelia TaxID=5888 RepID=A0DZQ1_PARTE|nr:uncharacterized protein GSPATT00021686001 [Paramecium tetraurelia]CAK88518.1 unnamed protein product [Paramecium tetraurelia]|eukprot:XP_001455915.1 hypothetical protein (macronuclear) [Paramecium tetraurelia strain d4-2]